MATRATALLVTLALGLVGLGSAGTAASGQAQAPKTTRAGKPAKTAKTGPSSKAAVTGRLVRIEGRPVLFTPPALLMPYSTFDQPVTTWRVDHQSSTIVANLVSAYKKDYNSVGVNYSMPIYQVPPGTPEATVSVAPGCNNFLPGTGRKVPVPSFATDAGSTDDPMVLYSPWLNEEWEFWRFSEVSPRHYQACWGGRTELSTSDGVFPYPYGESATGISYLATTVTEDDVLSGTIDHAIALIVPQCNASVAPADRTDCGSWPGQPSEGQRFRFAPNAQLPAGQPPFARMVFQAIKKYGLVVVDQGGAVQIEAEQTSDWAAQGYSGTDPITKASWGWSEYQLVNNLPWSQLQVVDPPAGGSGS